MQRSEVNRLQREALALFAGHRFALPPFATWSEAEWRENPETAAYCRKHQMGWDITDFGSGDFPRRGLVIFPGRLTAAGTFRIGVMGDLGESDMTFILEMIDEALAEIGIDRNRSAA